MSEPRILLADIETSPVLCWTWGLFKQNIGLPQIVRDSHLLTWAAKWIGDDHVMYDSLPANKETYGNDPYNDIHLVESIWHLLDEADIVIGQNGDRFDWPKINARMLYHGILPPSPFKTIDTLKIAKGSLRLTSNKLDWMARFLFEDTKDKTDFDLWTGCIAGNKKSWSKMVDYNIKDVTLLEDVYMELRPWARTHPNMALYHDEEVVCCPRCGSSHITKNGTRTSKTMLGRYQQYHCEDCGAYPRGRKNLNSKGKQSSLLTNSI